MYTLYLTDSFGVPFADIDDLIETEGAGLQYTRAVNTITDLTLVLPDRYSYIFKNESRYKDSRIEVWRRANNGVEYLDTQTVWFVRNIKKVVNEKGVLYFVVGAKSGNEILKRAIVAYAGQSAQAAKTGKIDDLMQLIVAENLGSSASGSRNRAPYLSVANSPGNGTTTTREFAYANVADILADLAQESLTTSVPVFFDVIYIPESKTFEFRVFANQRGQDRTIFNPLTLSLGEGLRSLQVEYDYTNEANYIYCGGSGEDSNRVVVEIFDNTAIGNSAIARRELFVNQSDTADTDALNAAAYTALQASTAKKTYTAQFDGTYYGNKFQFGDKLYADFAGEVVTARVDAISVSVERGANKIAGQLRVI